MKSIELFSGGGGLAIGLAKAGFEHQVMVESCSDAVDTILHNKNRGFQPFRDACVARSDVRLHDFSSHNKLDLIAGGPPCQPFSAGGKLVGYQDQRNMFPAAIDVVRQLLPKAFIFENVKGILRTSFVDQLEYIRLQLTYPFIIKKDLESQDSHFDALQDFHINSGKKECGYNVLVCSANAANYGVAQQRHRVFIIGFRSDLNCRWKFPEATHSHDSLLWDKWVSGEYWELHQFSGKRQPARPKALENKINQLLETGKSSSKSWVTVREALRGLPAPHKLKGTPTVANHVYRSGARIYKGHTGSDYDEPSKTIKAGVNGAPGGENMLRYLNGKVRYFTVRELARLQGFPDDYNLMTSWTKSTRILGNAVPVDLAESVGKSIYKALSSQGV